MNVLYSFLQSLKTAPAHHPIQYHVNFKKLMQAQYANLIQDLPVPLPASTLEYTRTRVGKVYIPKFQTEVRMDFIEWPAGSIKPFHGHPGDVSFYIIQGQLTELLRRPDSDFLVRFVYNHSKPHAFINNEIGRHCVMNSYTDPATTIHFSTLLKA